jgi:Short C-terminal domain
MQFGYSSGDDVTPRRQDSMNADWMRLAWRVATLVLAAVSMSALQAPAHAGLLDSLFGSSSKAEPAKTAPGQHEWILSDYTVIKIVPRESGSAPNQHPASVDIDRLRTLLGSVRYVEGGRADILFSPGELGELLEPLTQAFENATPADDVQLVSSARRGNAIIGQPYAVTARLFVLNGSLQLIVNDARFEFFNKAVGTRKPPQFTYGSRNRQGNATLRSEVATVNRADWLALPLSAAPAPAAAVAPAAAPAAQPAAAAGSRAREPGFADEIEQRLITLKRLRDKGLISEEEYQQKRKEVLSLL